MLQMAKPPKIAPAATEIPISGISHLEDLGLGAIGIAHSHPSEPIGFFNFDPHIGYIVLSFIFIFLQAPAEK